MKSTLIPVGVALALASWARADWNPIALTPGSFTADVIVEKAAPPPFPAYTSATMDGGTNNNAWTWCERGYVSSMPNTGLPVAGSSFSAADGSGHQFVMPPDYTTNNALCVYSAIPSGTLTLNTPVALQKLTVLNAGGGSSTNTYVIHHQGGGTETGPIDVLDWFNTAYPNIAVYSMGRVNMDNGNINQETVVPNSGQPRLFYFDITLTDTVNPVTSIDFTSSSGNRMVVLGLSGTSDGATYAPIPVTGFNRDMVVEAGANKVGNALSAITATLDGGPNMNGNTYYEKGYNRGTAASGLPAAGTTFAVGNHVYQMPATYVGNDALFIGNYTGFTTGTLTLATSATLSGLSILNGSGNGPVTINYTIHHADTSVESGSFSALDWFNTSATPAWICNGRTAPESLALNNVNASPQVPRVFFNDITTSGNASPVTSIDFA